MGGTVRGKPKHSGAPLGAVQLTVAFGLFLLDVLSPPGIADGMFYPIVLVLCLWKPKRWYALVWAVIAAGLVVAGGIIGGDDGSGGVWLIDRILAIVMIGVVWLLVRSRASAIETLRLREIEARQASEAKSAFLANMSHEFRTPLNAIIGFSDLLCTSTVRIAENKRNEYVHDIHTSANHLLALINDVLDLARIGAGKLELHEEIFSADEILMETLRMTSVQAKQKQLVVDANIAPQLPNLHADRRLVKQILLNLLANAVKFTPNLGRVAVEVGLTGAGFRFAVSDTGIGIPAEAIADLGRPYARASNANARAVTGTGPGPGALPRIYADARRHA